MKASLQWMKNRQFECNNRDLISHLDASVEHGGEASYPSPKELLLNAMMGCAGIDILHTLQKMRQKMEQFDLSIQAEETEEYPVHFKAAKLIFSCTGPLEAGKLQKAVIASMSKYCGVNFMISQSCHITYELYLNGILISEGQAQYES